MALDIKRLWARVKEPVLYTTVGAVLVLSIKQCGDENNTQSTVQSVAETTDSIYNVVNTVETVVVATQKVANDINTTVKRTEKKVDNVQETVDTMFARMDSCCDCNKNKKTVVRPRRPVPAVKPKPCTPDTVVIVKRDTVFVDEPKVPDTSRGITLQIECIENYKHVR